MSVKFAIRVEQFLHGYDRGHRLLRSSIELDEFSRSQMLVLSDLLSTSELYQGGSYLTAYPLKTAQRFVIARTWSAGPEFRPGSVWTHSIMVDYQALAMIPDISVLTSFLKCPILDQLDRYTESIDFSAPENDQPENYIDPRASEALALLYETPSLNDLVLPSTDSNDNEILALQLWRQMWPGMRRDFAFMTAVGNWPSGTDFSCALRYAKNNWLNPPPVQASSPIGFNLMLSDLPKHGPTELRNFLARYVIENKNPRSAVLSLAALFAIQKTAPFEIRIQAYRDLIPQLNVPRLSREFLLQEIGKISSARELITIIRMLSGIPCPVDLQDSLSRIVNISDRELRVLLDVSVGSSDDELGGKVFAEVVKISSLVSLANAVDEQTRWEVALLRPEIADEVAFWPRLDNEKISIFNKLAKIRKFNLNWGWKVFKSSLSQDIFSILLASTNEVVDGVVQFLISGKDEQRYLLANWLFEDRQRFFDLVAKIDYLEDEPLASLSSAQIRLGAIFKIEWWAKHLLHLKFKNDGFGYPSNLLVTGLVAALETDGEVSLILALKYFSPAVRAAISYGFTANEEKFLIGALKDLNPYLPTARQIIRRAINKWPISFNSLGVFRFTADEEMVDLIIMEVELAQHRSDLYSLLESSELSEIVRRRIEVFLSSKNKVWMLPWTWI